MQPHKLIGVFLVASLLTSCTITVQVPGFQTSNSSQNAIATIVAETLQPLGTPLASPAAGGGSATASPTFSKPMLAITGNSNCRTGPGASFKVVTAFTPGTDLEIVGRNTANNFWQVKIPNSTDTCWVWGQYATATGSVDTLSDSAPVASGGGVPSRPGSLFYNYTCSFGNLTTVLTWSDAADNETGYRVYRFDQLLADLPANSTTYTDNETVAPGTGLEYSVEAYNDAGASAKRTITFSCK